MSGNAVTKVGRDELILIDPYPFTNFFLVTTLNSRKISAHFAIRCSLLTELSSPVLPSPVRWISFM